MYIYLKNTYIRGSKNQNTRKKKDKIRMSVPLKKNNHKKINFEKEKSEKKQQSKNIVENIT